MYKVSVFIFSVLFISLNHLVVAQFNPIKEKKIDEKSLATATDLAGKLMNGMKSGSIYLLSEDEATAAMAKGLSEETQKTVYSKVKDENGHFKSLDFIEALQPENNKTLAVYRFKGKFENNEDGPEIRVVINKELKLSGFWILPWRDDIQGP